jgi:DNA-binding NarL/FixJ family response regulator
MTTTFSRALLLDDDPWALELLSAHLRARFPDLVLETRTTPEPEGGFDLYLIDNDFGGPPLAGQLARRIRAVSPDALVVAFSATLCPDTLRSLINAGCNGACDKSDPAELQQLLDIVGSFLAARPQPRRGLRGAIHDVRALLREWNRRLDQAEAVEARP